MTKCFAKAIHLSLEVNYGVMEPFIWYLVSPYKMLAFLLQSYNLLLWAVYFFQHNLDIKRIRGAITCQLGVLRTSSRNLGDTHIKCFELCTGAPQSKINIWQFEPKGNYTRTNSPCVVCPQTKRRLTLSGESKGIRRPSFACEMASYNGLLIMTTPIFFPCYTA